MKTTKQIIAFGVITGALMCVNANAAVSITNTGSFNGQYTNGTTLATLDFSAVNTTANTALFFIFSFDASTPSTTATFAGQTMNVTVHPDSRVTIGYLINPTIKQGNLVLNNSGGDASGSNEIAYWGVAQGINTNQILVEDAVDTNGGAHSAATFVNRLVGDVIFTGYAVNDSNVNSYSDTGLVETSGDQFEHDAIILRDNITTAGSFTPDAATPFLGGVPNSGRTSLSIAFTAAPVPEPSTSVLAALSVLALALRRQR